MFSSLPNPWNLCRCLYCSLMVRFISCVRLYHLEGRKIMVLSAFDSSRRILLDISHMISLEFVSCMLSPG